MRNPREGCLDVIAHPSLPTEQHTESAPHPSSSTSLPSAHASPSWQEFRQSVQDSSRGADIAHASSRSSTPVRAQNREKQRSTTQTQASGDADDDEENGNGTESPYPEYLSMTPKKTEAGATGRGSTADGKPKLNRSLFSANGSPLKGSSSSLVGRYDQA